MSKKFYIDKDELYNYYIIENHTKEETIKHFNASCNIITNRLREYNIKKPKELECKNRSKSLKIVFGVNWDKLNDRDYLYKLYCIDNMTKDDMAKMFNCSCVTISRQLSKFNIKRPSDLKSLNKSIGQKEKVDHVKSIAKTKATKLEKYGDPNYVNSEKCLNTKWKKYGKLNFCKFHQYLYDNEIFDSKPELAFWIYAKDHNENIEREPVRLEYFDNNNNKHFYTPDFRYNGQLIEIKGDYFFNEDGEFIDPYNDNRPNDKKFKCMIDNNVKIFTSAQYNKYLDYIKLNNIDLDKYKIY